MKNNILAVSIIILSISLIYCGFQFKSSIQAKPNVEEKVETGLMTMEETAEYLSMPFDDFETLIYQQDQYRKTLQSFDTYNFIPYIELKGKKYFNKNQVNEWIKEGSMSWKVYEYFSETMKKERLFK
ncbi:hypothetical protein [Peribacillus acanthi]|uniref:hypothetical protein n=1 Tax=Peribacillus acanthi TaxID=2171554 RepID=UPI000D3EAA77|nr:hypothetical protein [Peribacillus acanthi]